MLDDIRAAAAIGDYRQLLALTMREVPLTRAADRAELAYHRVLACAQLKFRVPRVRDLGRNLADRALFQAREHAPALVPMVLVQARDLAYACCDLIGYLQHTNEAFAKIALLREDPTRSPGPERALLCSVLVARLQMHLGLSVPGSTRRDDTSSQVFAILAGRLDAHAPGYTDAWQRWNVASTLMQASDRMGEVEHAAHYARLLCEIVRSVEWNRPLANFMGPLTCQALFHHTSVCSFLAHFGMSSLLLEHLHLTRTLMAQGACDCSHFGVWLRLGETALACGSSGARRFIAAAARAFPDLAMPGFEEPEVLSAAIRRLAHFKPRRLPAELADLLQPEAWPWWKELDDSGPARPPDFPAKIILLN